MLNTINLKSVNTVVPGDSVTDELISAGKHLHFYM